MINRCFLKDEILSLHLNYISNHSILHILSI